METNKILFTEAFRPKTLDQCILLPRIREELSRGLVDNQLYAGSPGCGKTTCSRIMAKLGADSITINASLERGIDVIRETVVNFASTISLFGGSEQLKVIILEECDNLTDDAWKSLRGVIEQYHNSVRFIANCNYIEKIPDPIKSRFNCILFDPQNKEEEDYLLNEYTQRAGKILNAVKITYTEENLKKFIENDFPDMRTIVKKIQQLYTRGISELTPETLGQSYDYASLFNIILNGNNPQENYKALLADWSTKAEDACLIIGKQFPEYLQTVKPDKIDKLPLLIISICEHQNMLATAIDKFIVLTSMVFKLQMILR